MGWFDGFSGFMDSARGLFGGGGGDNYTAPEVYSGPYTDVSPDASLGNAGSNTTFSPPEPKGWSFGDVGKSIAGGIRSVTEPMADIGKAISPLATIGGAVMGGVASTKAAGALAEQSKIARRAEGLQEQQANKASAAAAPLTNFGQAELERANHGQIPEAIQQKINLWSQGAKQKMHDYLARSGQGDSQQLAIMDAWIDQQAQAMAGDYLMQESSQGIGAITAGAGVIGNAGNLAHGVGQTASGQQQNLETLIQNANQEIMKLGGGAA